MQAKILDEPPDLSQPLVKLPAVSSWELKIRTFHKPFDRFKLKFSNTDEHRPQQATSGGGQNFLLGLLDSDNDGSAMDDVLDLAKRFF